MPVRMGIRGSERSGPTRSCLSSDSSVAFQLSHHRLHLIPSPLTRHNCDTIGSERPVSKKEITNQTD